MDIIDILLISIGYILLSSICSIIVWEIDELFKYGLPIRKFNLNGYKVSSEEPQTFTIIYINSDFRTYIIRKRPFSILFKYAIKGEGLIWRHSKLSKELDSLLEESK